MSRSLTVQEMVDAELQRDPSVSLTDLKWLAERVDPSLTELSDDEFRARYAAGAGQAGATETSRPAKKAGGVKKARSGAERRKSAAAAARKRPAAKAAPKAKAPAKTAKNAPAKAAKKAPAKAAKQTPAKAPNKASTAATGKAPVKQGRAKAPTSRGPGKAPRKAVANPETTAVGDLAAARAALLDFARDLTAAESRGELVKVLADVDRYARRVLDARG